MADSATPTGTKAETLVGRAVPDLDEVADYVEEWSRLPHPLEAAVLSAVNTHDPAADRAAVQIHRRPPGLEGPSRPVWVLAVLAPSGEGERQRLRSWCWYATRQAAEAAAGAVTEGRTLLLETAVPRSVRCDGVCDWLAGQYRCPTADPAQ